MSDTASATENQDSSLLALVKAVHTTRLEGGNAEPSPSVSAEIARRIFISLAEAGYEIRAVEE